MFQNLPPEQKKTLALISSGFITLVIMSFWLVSFIQDTYTKKDNIVAGSVSVYDDFKSSIGGRLSDLSENFSSLKSLTTDMIKNIGKGEELKQESQ